MPDLRRKSLKHKNKGVKKKCTDNYKPHKNFLAHVKRKRTEEEKKHMSELSSERMLRKDPFYMVDGIEHKKVLKKRVNTHCGVLTEKELMCING